MQIMRIKINFSSEHSHLMQNLLGRILKSSWLANWIKISICNYKNRQTTNSLKHIRERTTESLLQTQSSTGNTTTHLLSTPLHRWTLHHSHTSCQHGVTEDGHKFSLSLYLRQLVKDRLDPRRYRTYRL